MNKNFIYVGLGLVVLVALFAFYQKQNKPSANAGVNIDTPTMKTFVEYLYSRGYTVDQLPEDVRSELPPSQIEELREPQKKYKG
jgi:hypothetical protein